MTTEDEAYKQETFLDEIEQILGLAAIMALICAAAGVAIVSWVF